MLLITSPFHNNNNKNGTTTTLHGTYVRSGEATKGYLAYIVHTEKTHEKMIAKTSCVVFRFDGRIHVAWRIYILLYIVVVAQPLRSTSQPFATTKSQTEKKAHTTSSNVSFFFSTFFLYIATLRYYLANYIYMFHFYLFHVFFIAHGQRRAWCGLHTMDSLFFKNLFHSYLFIPLNQHYHLTVLRLLLLLLLDDDDDRVCCCCICCCREKSRPRYGPDCSSSRRRT